MWICDTIQIQILKQYLWRNPTWFYFLHCKIAMMVSTLRKLGKDTTVAGNPFLVTGPQMVLAAYITRWQTSVQIYFFSELCTIPWKDLRSCSNLESLRHSLQTLSAFSDCIIGTHIKSLQKNFQVQSLLGYSIPINFLKLFWLSHFLS